MILDALDEMHLRDWLVLLALSIVVSTCGVIGVSYVAGSGWAIFDTVQTILLIVIFTIVAAIVFFLMDVLFFWVCLTRAREDDRLPNERKPLLARLTPHWQLKSIAIFAAIMALFWLPWLIANYPGGTYWDTYYQIYQIYPENHPISIIPWEEIREQTITDAWLVDHHPVLTTLLYGAFGYASDLLTGNWMLGVFTFVCIQGVAHIIAFTCAIAYMRQRHCPLVLCFCAYLFFCIMPFISTWAMCMVKDSLFGALCIPYFIMLFEAVRTRGASLRGAFAIVLFCELGLLLCLTRKMGIFMVVPTALIAAIVLRRGKRPHLAESGAVRACLIQAGSCVAIMALLLPLLIFPLTNISPGGKQEILGPLFQQTARYLVDHGDEISATEKRAIQNVLDYDKLADEYQFDFADSVKYRYNIDATPEQLLDYMKAYISMGIRHPESYLAAFASLAGYYVAPTAFANIRMVTVDTHMGDNDRYMLWNPDELDWLRHGMDDAYTAIAETPGINLPLLIVTYVFWLPAGLIFVLVRRRLRCGILLVPTLILLAFCVISPVYDARYCVPIFDMAPLLVCAFAAICIDTQPEIANFNEVETDFKPMAHYNTFNCV
ncbi:DUF6020 family protein [Adlercreutzia sp. ZJ304]|uniref:DUF6020 family protein n=1 Tax=Adlercreutzia sp. ZJ304 TaxID=2709791 RepID=UPI0013EB9369|nr:DUF6020 family protein [Adlercreutzia sp. ZJ304]